METIDFNAKKGFLCDMDGVIYHGNRILPGVADFIQWLHEENKEYLFLTNNSGYTPRELQQKLARMGLDVPEEHFYTSALATAAFLKDQAPGCSVFAIGEAGLLNALYDAGLTMNDVNPDYVVGVSRCALHLCDGYTVPVPAQWYTKIRAAIEKRTIGAEKHTIGAEAVDEP